MPTGILAADAWATSLTFAHTVGWSVYLGGAILMEVVWRPSQVHIPPSQVNVVCSRMGRRYRWVSFAALLVIAASGIALLFESGSPLVLSTGYARTLLALALLWVILVGLLGVLAVAAHPALHVRTPASMSDEARRAARESVRRAIRRMDVLLRVELGLAGLAALLATSLQFGGLF
ncbi:MAG: hypothetical protein IT198_15215 [Acidimicrobiia bacterium]|nr:hypothetical protein [Acidimicrobiia bacterium]